jgi:hypothetical protein
MPVRSNVVEFQADLQAASKAFHLTVEQMVRAVVIELLRMVIMRTPVDTGRAASSWNVRGGEADEWVPAVGITATREEALSAAMSRLSSVDFGGADIFTLYSNLEYIHVLEFGLYPNPPKKGSYVKGQGYVIKSEGGYSKQAPAGMVRISVAELEVRIEYAIRAAAQTGGSR